MCICLSNWFLALIYIDIFLMLYVLFSLSLPWITRHFCRTWLMARQSVFHVIFVADFDKLLCFHTYRLSQKIMGIAEFEIRSAWKSIYMTSIRSMKIISNTISRFSHFLVPKPLFDINIFKTILFKFFFDILNFSNYVKGCTR